jgi:hypothetical protein
MLDFFSQSILLFFVCLILTYARLSRAISYSGGVPRVGKPGVLGYIQTALRWTIDGESIILEGRKQFSNQAICDSYLGKSSSDRSLRLFEAYLYLI